MKNRDDNVRSNLKRLAESDDTYTRRKLPSRSPSPQRDRDRSSRDRDRDRASRDRDRSSRDRGRGGRQRSRSRDRRPRSRDRRSRDRSRDKRSRSKDKTIKEEPEPADEGKRYLVTGYPDSSLYNLTSGETGLAGCASPKLTNLKSKM